MTKREKENLVYLLSISYGVDALLAENDINPEHVIEWLVEEELLNLTDYMEEQDNNE